MASAVTLKFRGTVGGSSSMYVSDIAALRQLVGDQLLIQFLRCFVGSDRLCALEQLIDLSREKQGTDSPEAERNQTLLFFLLGGTLHELGDALQSLCSAKVVMSMADQSKWTPLNELRKKWRTGPLSSKVRNQIAHHLGEADFYSKGLDQMAGETLLYDSSGEERLGGRFRGAWDAVILGMNIDDQTELPGFTTDLLDATRRLPALLMEVFVDVLSKAGVRVVDERVEPPVKPMKSTVPERKAKGKTPRRKTPDQSRPTPRKPAR